MTDKISLLDPAGDASDEPINVELSADAPEDAIPRVYVSGYRGGGGAHEIAPPLDTRTAIYDYVTGNIIVTTLAAATEKPT